MCNVFKVSRSGFYAWQNKMPSTGFLENKCIIEEIKSIFKESYNTYGSSRISAELANRKMYVSRPRVARLMKKEGIVSRVKKKYKITTNSKHKYSIMDNLLKRDFAAENTGLKWVSDITYIRTMEGWLYLTIVLDLGDRKIIGWSFSKRMKTIDTIIPAWKMAVKNRPITEKLIFHSDRGVQYACTEFATILKQNKMVLRSMSRKGDCWDNAVAESFFKTLKTEIIYGYRFKTRKEATQIVFHYIEYWYNRKRIHSSLGFKSPEKYYKQLIINAA